MAYIPTTKQCEHCGITYRVTPGRYHKSKFCSYACMGAAQIKQTVAKVCERCGATYERSSDESPARFLKSKYCSRSCSGQAAQTLPQVQAARNHSPESTPELKSCEICGALYGAGTRRPHQFRKSKYCSIQCSAQAQQVDIDHVLKRVVVDPETGCHNWTGHTTVKGYGVTNLNGEQIMVHRAVWEHSKGPIPEGLQIDHLCRNTSCCNVEHLRVVTPGENTLGSNNMAARYAKRENCDKCGGPFSFFSSGIRYCKSCRNEKFNAAQRLRRAANKVSTLKEKI